MNHRNTLNTRLLPLSILISSLVSGGAMAANTTLTPTVGIQVTSNTVVSTTKPEDVLLEAFFPAGKMEKEDIERVTQHITSMKNEHAENIKNIEAHIKTLTAEQQNQANKELASEQVVFDKKINQFEAAIAFAQDQSEDNKNKLHTAAQDAFVATINAQAPGQFTADEANSLFNAALTNDNSAISLELEQKATAVKQQQQASQNTLTKVQNYLIQGVISQEQKEKLAAYFAEKQAKFNELAVAKRAEEEAKKVNTKAKADAAILNVKSVLLKTSVENAGKEKKQAEDNLKQLDTDKNTVIEAVDPNWNANTPDLDKKLQELIDNPNTLQDKIKEAKEAQEAIKKANTAKLLVDDATKKHQSADVAFNNNELKVTAANQIKTDTASKLVTSTTEMQNAAAALTILEKVTTTTVDIPAFEQKIASAEQQTVDTGTFALDTQVSGGTQNVETGGEIIGSIISEDGTVNLALGALANSTVITKGTMQNNSGTDKNTVVGAEGVLALKGASDTELAQSKGAVIAQGGKVTIAQYSLVSDMVSEGEIIATDGAMISKANIKGGNLTLRSKAIATDTVLNDGIFTVETGAGATGTTVNGGQFIVNDGATVQKTVLNNSQFDLKAKATAEHTIVNKAANLTLRLRQRLSILLLIKAQHSS
ncbi:hypothetical protein [Yersinia enterocolitica]|uniref:hypothetical protein n=1 Tax=Yersinia enterocolitica TaxID=630 RepID=UPI0002F9545C|nr:hypothetical protein [Yersinia enterocolitica]